MSTFTVAEMLAELNGLRHARGQQQLKSWKGSRAALEQTITAYKTHKVAPAVAEGAYNTSTQAEGSTELKGTHARKREAIAKANVPANETSTQETTMPKSSKKSAPAKKTSDLVSLADIARELKIEPKIARAKARRSDDIIKLNAGGDTSWAFTPANAAKVKALLKK